MNEVLSFPGLNRNEAHVSILGVTIPVHAAGARTPLLARFSGDAITTFDLELMRDLATELLLNHPVRIVGGTGIGKTHAVKRMAALTGQEVYYVNCRDMSAETIIGTPTIDEKGTVVWRDGLMLQAIRNGGILYFDEYNMLAGDVRAGLHQIFDELGKLSGAIVLADNKGEVVPVHPNFRLIAADNPLEGHRDRKELDAPQYSRWTNLEYGLSLASDVQEARMLGILELDNEIGDISHLYFKTRKDPLSRAELGQVSGIVELTGKVHTFLDTIKQQIAERKLAVKQGQSVHLTIDRTWPKIVDFIRHFYDGDLLTTARQALTIYVEKLFSYAEDKKTVKELINAVELSTASKKRLSLSPLDDLSREERDLCQDFLAAIADGSLAGDRLVTTYNLLINKALSSQGASVLKKEIMTRRIRIGA